MIDLPFALPTIVASLILLELYGNNSPVGIDIALTRAAVVVALLFVTLPFVVRAVQPLLIEMDREMEEAAASLGAERFHRSSAASSSPTCCPASPPASPSPSPARSASSVPSCSSPAACPNTQVSSVFIRQQIESGNETGAAAVSVVLLAACCLVAARR